MSGYAATARITRVAPHRAARHEPPSGSPGDHADSVELDLGVVEELTGQPFLAALLDWWDDIREVWRQGMDVLRDPQSIR